MRVILFSVIGILLTFEAKPQENIRNFQSMVRDEQGLPIEFASVVVIDEADSTMVCGQVTDKDGIFDFSLPDFGSYILNVSHVSYEGFFRKIEMGDRHLPASIILKSRNNLIDEVTITSEFVRKQAGGFTVKLTGNPIVSGKSATEILGILPGVSSHNGIAIHGIGGTQVFIDGRKIRDDRELESLDADRIESVQVVYVAGSSFDAQSKGGLIFIKLKKLADGILTGSTGLGGGVRPKYGFTSENLYSIVSFRRKSVNMYNYLYYQDFKNISFYETENLYTVQDELILAKDKERGWQHSFSENLSLVYEPNFRNTLGVNAGITTNRFNPKSHSDSEVYDGVGGLIGLSSSDIGRNNKTNQYQVALNYELTLDSIGSCFNLIADYLNSRKNSRSDYFYQYDIPGRIDHSTKDTIKNITDMFEGDAKFEFKFHRNSRLGTGMRYYYNSTNHHLVYYNQNIGEEWVLDKVQSDDVNIKSDGLGAYIDFSSEVRNFSYSLGLRVQSDIIQYKSYLSDMKIRNRYNNFFPTIKLGYLLEKEKTDIYLDFSYHRGIDYMPINEITPVVVYGSEYFYTKGNSELKPVFGEDIEVSLSVFDVEMWYNYSISKNGIQYLTLLDRDDPLVRYSMPVNTAKSYYHLAGIERDIQIFPWWKLNMDFMFRHMKVNYWEEEHKNTYHSNAFFPHIQNNFSFSDNTFGFSLTFYAESTEKIDDKKMCGVYSFSLSAYKYFFNKRFLIRFNSQPVISKLRRWITDKPELYTYSRFRTNQTSFNILLSYHFKYGKSTNVKRARSIQNISERKERK